MAGKYKIEQKEKTKILGFIISNNLNHDSYINNMISKVNKRINKINMLSKCMNYKVKIRVNTAMIISIISYVMPLLISINKKQLNTIIILINKVARSSLGFHAMKCSNIKVLRTCNLLNRTQMIYYNTINLIHKINYNDEPKSIIYSICIWGEEKPEVYV